MIVACTVNVHALHVLLKVSINTVCFIPGAKLAQLDFLLCKLLFCRCYLTQKMF